MLNRSRPAQLRELPPRAFRQAGPRSGYTIMEGMVVLVLLGISAGAIFSAFGVMRLDNVSGAQRMLAASVAAEMLELLKAQPYETLLTASTANGTNPVDASNNPIYLKAGDGRWQVPAKYTNSRDLPIENSDSTSSSPGMVDHRKLPGAQWSVSIRPIATTDETKAEIKDTVKVELTVNWTVMEKSQRKGEYKLSTIISKAYPKL